MRNLGLVVVMMLAAFVTKAQTQQGKFLLGGGFNISSTSYESGSDNYTNFSINPKVGYFFADNWAIGADLSFRTYGYSDKTNNFSFGPFVRYYKQLGDSKASFYAEGSVGFGSGKSNNDIKSSSFNVYVSPGLAYFFNERFAADFSFRGIGFESTEPNKDNPNDRYSTFTFGINSFSPSLGFYYFFGN